ncbi:restriction endonuclease [Cardiobacterium valvarum]|uniref:Type III restriction-modification system StyLTI enzyme res n=1 Tax=Cardiobacterium valvarum TaxID=194702 RepID=A0A381DY61_9GAMM|nr:DEAD/DEAH box helicase family protein [Cardiobacterium valvarum]SUX18265.1 type III restriction-modification system StyLTI enzyme res [Cardiobacterium valvarum]
MELQFEELPYQLDAVNAIVNLFTGQPNPDEAFSLSGGEAGRFVGNTLVLDEETVSKNLNAVQRRNGQPETDIGAHGLNFSLEMETGTGKTYVYLRTIYELNRRYGWKKFVIVVPSVAIREGVLQTLRSTKAHFNELFDKPIAHYAEYKSGRLSDLRAFAVNSHIEILVLNIQSFEKELNVINQVNESGDAPIKFIQEVRPIVVIDEPQNMETAGRLNALASLNPLFTLRYSATHKKPYHKVYSLNPVQAYNLKLVKQIEVLSVLTENDVNGAFVELLEVKQAAKSSLKADINIHFRDKKETKKKKISVKKNDDVFAKSGGNEAYRHGFIIDGMDFDNQALAFSSGKIITRGSDDAVYDEIMKSQIRATVKEHLAKEKRLNPQGIKVLSLFFIDRVENYRAEGGMAGKFARWFEEIYREETKGQSPDGVHNGYFSQDRKGRLKNTDGTTQADNDTYHLIMRDKETLLSFASPLRFIFSHSALKEGWDNPNVFQICTLNETRSPLKKRQEIGRGLRLAVNQDGGRVYDEKTNILTVIPNESYESFAANLQKEYEDECGVKFAAANIKDGSKKKKQFFRKDFPLDPEFQAVWDKIKYQTRYRVQFDTEELIKQAAAAVMNLSAIQPPKIRYHKASLAMETVEYDARDEAPLYNLTLKESFSGSSNMTFVWDIPDILAEMQRKTGLTRRTLFAILTQSGRLHDAVTNPQRFVDSAAAAVNRSLQKLMVQGIKYERTDAVYAQSLLTEMERNGIEFYANEHTFTISNPQKTICENYIPLDSYTEKRFAADCENYDAGKEGGVIFYCKLPHWFKIPTPLGNYNPDWAVVMRQKEKAYFIAETKNTGQGDGIDMDKLREEERMKIRCARVFFNSLDDIEYKAVGKVEELNGQ